ncbi:MAG: SDR family NAD(P)-dependent oxidoreductase, partial [Chitinophagaceae bacterium]|nr:SDR family NAD(P)-dependent oxidoreductase [Chitinophagaceae bacterium]
MNLQLNNQLFIVGGATSGFGKAITQQLLAEGARVIAIARTASSLTELYAGNPMVHFVVADLGVDTNTAIDACKKYIGAQQLHGIVINAGGPPAKTVLETTLSDWDHAYQLLLRWKVAFTQAFIPQMIAAGYGRIVFIESYTVKQPAENLVLSNSLRAAVVGMVKTLSQEVAKTGVTLNIMGPGSHNTPAINRIYKNKAEKTGQT